MAQAELEPSEVQDLADLIPQLLEIKNKFNMPLVLRVRVELGDGNTAPNSDSIASVNVILKEVKEGFELK